MVRRKNGPAGRKKAADGGTNGNGRGEPVDYGPLADWVGFNLRMAQAAAFQAFSRLAQEIGTRPGRFATLMLIGRNPGISQTALSRANARDKSTLTPALTDLARRRLITRTRLKSDRRSYQLRLTPAGEDMLKRLTAYAAEHDRNLDRIVGKRDRAKFLQILQRLVADLA